MLSHNNNRPREFAPLPPIPGRGNVLTDDVAPLSDEFEALPTDAASTAPGPADGWRWLDPLLPPETASVGSSTEPSASFTEEYREVVSESSRVLADEPEPVADLRSSELPELPAEPRRQARGSGRGRMVMAVFFGVIILGLVSGGAWLAFSNGDTETPSAAALDEPIAAEAPVENGAQPACLNKSSGNTVTGAGKGDQASGPGVISAFNYAYYVERDANAARAVTVKNTVSPDLQKYIDGTPEGTTHCLTITSRGDGLWAVQIALTAPGQQPDLIKQLVQTTEVGGRFWITSFTKDQG
ncbi:hypothetical protein [Gordonia sp. (in: high G+C Gram-positive bacteria)]|uniref:hypothetical protein n=1 Tax=Gordonia sp. (in: high G+C Gram-positive bacteria) TaxID=84139 RepID=UPI003C7289DB